MTNRYKSFVEKFYLKEELKPSLLALFMNRILQAVCFGFFALYLPIFIYKTFNDSFEIVIFYYILNYLLYAAVVVFGAKLMSRLGLRESMIISTFFLIGFFLGYRYFQPEMYYLFFLIIIITLFRILYWVPYHTEFAEFTDRRHRGREVAFLNVLFSILKIGIPVTGGFIISRYGYNNLFILVIIIAFISILPLFLTSRVKESFSWGYFETFKKIFSKGNRAWSLAFFADGLQDVVGLVIWPIYIFIILKEKYISVGLVSTLIILVVIVLRLLFGKFSDEFSKHKLLRYSSFLYALGWIFKGLVHSFSHIFLAGAYHDFSKAMMKTPFDALRYEKAADHGHYVDEYTVLREIALSLGRVVMLVIILFLFHFLNLRVAFYLAAFASLFISIL